MIKNAQGKQQNLVFWTTLYRHFGLYSSCCLKNTQILKKFYGRFFSEDFFKSRKTHIVIVMSHFDFYNITWISLNESDVQFQFCALFMRIFVYVSPLL